MARTDSDHLFISNSLSQGQGNDWGSVGRNTAQSKSSVDWPGLPPGKSVQRQAVRAGVSSLCDQNVPEGIPVSLEETGLQDLGGPHKLGFSNSRCGYSFSKASRSVSCVKEDTQQSPAEWTSGTTNAQLIVGTSLSPAKETSLIGHSPCLPLSSNTQQSRGLLPRITHTCVCVCELTMTIISRTSTS